MEHCSIVTNTFQPMSKYINQAIQRRHMKVYIHVKSNIIYATRLFIFNPFMME